MRPAAFIVIVFLAQAFSSLRAEPPNIGEIIKRVLNGSKEAIARQREESKYLFNKLSISEDLDPQGNIKSRREKLYEVRQIDGVPFTHLIKLNGKPLSETDQIRRKAHEKKVYQQLKEKNESRQDYIVSEDVISRFAFTLQGIQIVNGRDTFAINFRPKTNGLPANRMEDKIINRLTGQVWIDAQEYELVRIECHLTAKTEIWGGLLGSIQELNMSLRRRREGPHLWFNEDSQFEVRARKLIENFHLRVHEVGTNFRRIPPGDELGELSK